MQLLASHGKRSTRESTALVVLVSRDVVGCNGKPVDLRSGVQGSGFVKGVAYSREGHLLIMGPEGASVQHPDGKVVPLKVEGPGVLEPVFVGSALVMQDDPMRSRGLGVFDVNTGALRGRLEHERVNFGPRSMVMTTMFNPNDGRHLWLTDVHRLRCWDLESVRCVREIAMPAGTTCASVAVLPDGGVVTSIRPEGDPTPERAEVAVFNGDKIARKRSCASAGLLVVKDKIVVQVWNGAQLIVFDASLEPVETIPLPPTVGTLVPMLNLWSDDAEFIGAGSFNQVHHFGDAALAPKEGAPAESGGAKKAPAKKAAKKK